MQPYLIYPTGSTYIVGHGADIDTVLLFESRHEAELYRIECGYTVCGGEYSLDNDDFYSMRKGDHNIIVVWDHLQFLKWCAFTELARTLGLSEKIDRIELSKAIVEDNEQAAVNITHRPGIYDEMHKLTANYLGA